MALSTQFYKDLEIGKRGESIVKDTLFFLSPGIKIKDLSNDPQYYYVGDLRVTTPEGKEVYLEVKNDSRIHETHNLLLEDEVYFKERGEFRKGNMHCKCDIYAVVSEPERKIYFFNFKKLKENYKKGYFECIRHAQQDTYCYLANLTTVKKRWGALIATVGY